jgi:hypothetical protein
MLQRMTDLLFALSTKVPARGPMTTQGRKARSSTIPRTVADPVICLR